MIEPCTRVIERTNAASSRTADWGMMGSPICPIVVDSDTPLSLGGLPEPHARKNLFAAGPISPIVDELDAEKGQVGPPTPDPHGHPGPARESMALNQQALSGPGGTPVWWNRRPLQ